MTSTSYLLLYLKMPQSPSQELAEKSCDYEKLKWWSIFRETINGGRRERSQTKKRDEKDDGDEESQVVESDDEGSVRNQMTLLST
jgi:hypothetical protein